MCRKACAPTVPASAPVICQSVVFALSSGARMVSPPSPPSIDASEPPEARVNRSSPEPPTRCSKPAKPASAFDEPLPAPSTSHWADSAPPLSVSSPDSPSMVSEICSGLSRVKRSLPAPALITTPVMPAEDVPNRCELPLYRRSTITPPSADAADEPSRMSTTSSSPPKLADSTPALTDVTGSADSSTRGSRASSRNGEAVRS